MLTFWQRREVIFFPVDVELIYCNFSHVESFVNIFRIYLRKILILATALSYLYCAFAFLTLSFPLISI